MPTKIKNLSEETLYYQLEYHRWGVPREVIQQKYRQYIAPHLPHTLTVAFNRPRNLKDLLCKSRLPLLPGKNPSDILRKLRKEKANDHQK